MLCHRAHTRTLVPLARENDEVDASSAETLCAARAIRHDAPASWFMPAHTSLITAATYIVSWHVRRKIGYAR